MALKTDKKKMDAVVKSIEERINKRYEGHSEADKETYGVSVEVDYNHADIMVYPNNRLTFYCIEELMLIAEFYKVSKLVTISDGSIAFNLFGFHKH